MSNKYMDENSLWLRKDLIECSRKENREKEMETYHLIVTLCCFSLSK